MIFSIDVMFIHDEFLMGILIFYIYVEIKGEPAISDL